MASDTAALASWVGRSESVVDVIDPIRVRQLAATLGDAARLASPAAAALPAGWHWAWFNPLALPSGLGDDGHPHRGDFLPPVRLPRRMWAGSRLTWHRVFTVGSAVTRDSRILSVQARSGRGGDMVFVTVGHRYHDDGGTLLDEEHDIVYRAAASDRERAALSALGVRVRAGEHAFERAGARQQAVHADSVLLFRYSAATFNGHRIHYDVDYCRDVEGYPGLVVHGPLLATLLLGFVENTLAPGRFVQSFAFRARRPSFAIGPLHLHAAGAFVDCAMDVWSTDNLGAVAIDARVKLG